MFRKALACILSFTLLVATTGVVVVTHTCLASADKSASLFQDDNCCPGEATPCGPVDNKDAHLEAKCCVTDYNYQRAGTVSHAVEKDVRILPVLATLSPSLDLTGPKTVQSPVLYTGEPNKDSGRKILLSLHRLLI